jgi:hypothetical protein
VGIARCIRPRRGWPRAQRPQRRRSAKVFSTPEPPRYNSRQGIRAVIDSQQTPALAASKLAPAAIPS